MIKLKYLMYSVMFCGLIRASEVNAMPNGTWLCLPKDWIDYYFPDDEFKNQLISLYQLLKGSDETIPTTLYKSECHDGFYTLEGGETKGHYIGHDY
jgi:hypothetical protein